MDWKSTSYSYFRIFKQVFVYVDMQYPIPVSVLDIRLDLFNKLQSQLQCTFSQSYDQILIQVKKSFSYTHLCWRIQWCNICIDACITMKQILTYIKQTWNHTIIYINSQIRSSSKVQPGWSNLGLHLRLFLFSCTKVYAWLLPSITSILHNKSQIYNNSIK